MPIFAVTTGKGASWVDGRPIREQAQWHEHAAFVDDLVARGTILVGGPIGGSDDDVALLAVVAADEAELRSIFDGDPWTASGVFRIKEVRLWTWWLDGRTHPPAGR